MTSRPARRWHDVRVQRRAGFFFLAAVALVVLAGCAAKPDNTAASPGPAPATGPFAEFDRNARNLVTREANWQAPQSLTVGRTERIGLSIGDGPSLNNKIKTLMQEGSQSTSAGSLQVGSVVRATLRASSADAEITPSEAVNVSTGSDIQMLWTWFVHPKRPTDRLQLTAFLEVPLENGHIVSHELGFSLPVKRTLLYTLEEVATHWGTWSAVAATLASVIGWFIRRRRRRRRAAPGGPDDQPPPVEPAPAQQLAA